MGGYPSQMFAHLYPQKVQCFIGVDTTPFGTAYYSKSDLWWLSKVKPMANWFTDKMLRKSMAKSIYRTNGYCLWKVCTGKQGFAVPLHIIEDAAHFTVG